ncbi:hypothetical protein ACFL2V_10270 [Pseudomonadota bacterium]
MSDGKTGQLRLSAVGFDGRSEESFKIAFKGPGKGKAVLVGEEVADGGIINMDSAGAKDLWVGFRERHPNKPAIILGVNNPGIEDSDTVFVQKPASIDQMLEAVDRLMVDLGVGETEVVVAAPEEDEKPLFRTQSESLPSNQQPQNNIVSAGKFAAKAAIAEPVAANLPAAAIKSEQNAASASTDAKAGNKFSLFYNPRDYLQSEMHSAADYSSNKGVAVEIWVMTGDDRWGKIIFMPGLRRVITSFSDSELKQYCSTPLSLLNHKMYRRKPKDTQELEERMDKERRGCSYESFLWKAALYTSLGRLPQGTNLGTTMHLKHWPNFTRLYPLGGSMRIATLLIDQPRTLPLIAKVLKMPVGRVFSFYSAACAIGLVETGEPMNVNLAKSTIPKKHRDHTLFGRILKRLRAGDSEVEAYA